MGVRPVKNRKIAVKISPIQVVATAGESGMKKKCPRKRDVATANAVSRTR